MLLALWISLVSFDDSLVGPGKALVHSAPQLRFEEDEEGWIIEGVLYRKEDLERVRELVKRAEGRVRDRTRLSDELKSELEPKTRQKKTQATKRSLFLEVAFVELTKTFLSDLGFRFGSPFEFSTAPELSSQLLSFKSRNPIASMLDFALKKGHARVHHKQSLVTIEGEEADFFSGGEINLRSLTESYAGVTSISYGMHIEFLPRFVSQSRLQVDLKTEISQPDYSNSLDGIPVIQRKTVSTQVQGELEKTMAVAGLFHELNSEGTQGLPALSKIPWLGRLFESKAYRERRSEAYIFLTFRELKEVWIPEVTNE